MYRQHSIINDQHIPTNSRLLQPQSYSRKAPAMPAQMPFSNLASSSMEPRMHSCLNQSQGASMFSVQPTLPSGGYLEPWPTPVSNKAHRSFGMTPKGPKSRVKLHPRWLDKRTHGPHSLLPLLRLDMRGPLGPGLKTQFFAESTTSLATCTCSLDGHLPPPMQMMMLHILPTRTGITA